ncbi:MAG: hydroxysqualene dehydroxylase HpnE [Alphaproteobacteria bacterium]
MREGQPPPTTHVIGAGLAGLACAVRLAGQGRPVALYEATDHGGGRARSFFDQALGRVIDNGNHLILSGNVATQRYLREIGAAGTMISPSEAVYPFVDLRTGERWTVHPNRGRIPWWIFAPARRVPQTRARDYLAGLRLATADPSATVADCFQALGPAYERFWRPLAVAVLNTPPEEGAARLLWPVIRLIFAKGEAASRPCLASNGLSASLVDPALAYLRARGCTPAFNRRLRALAVENGCVAALRFGDDSIPVSPQDQVVVAVPPTAARELIPDLAVPKESNVIVNVHFLLPAPPPPLCGDGRILGIVGGTAEWLFLRGDIASVTVSAASRLAEEEPATIAGKVWTEVVAALGLGGPSAPPPYRVIKERRATFAQTPDSLSLRPHTRTRIGNLFLAGDWTDTGLPATIEGAVTSGQRAAAAVLERAQRRGSP